MDYQLRIGGYTTKMYMLISGKALSRFSREKSSSCVAIPLTVDNREEIRSARTYELLFFLTIVLLE